MVERVRIGASGSPLRVLDASGNIDPLACLFDANFQVMRAPTIVGAANVGQGVTNIFYGRTLPRAPFFFMQWFNGVRQIHTPWNHRSQDNTSVAGTSARSFTDHLEIMHWTFGGSTTVYYAVLRNMIAG